MATGLEPLISVGLLKEVYTSVRIAIKVAKDAKHNTVERQKLIEELEDEHLFVETFGKLLEERGWKIVRDPNLNERWLVKVNKEFTALRAIFAEYAQLGAEMDRGYKTFCPLALEPSDPKNLLTFGNFVEELQKIDDQDNEAVLVTNTQSQLTVTPKPVTQSVTSKTSKFDLRFALLEKGSLKSILKDCRERTSKLREIQAVMQTGITQPVIMKIVVRDPTSSPTQSDPAKSLLPYQRLREITNGAESAEASVPIKPAINLSLKGRTISTYANGLWQLASDDGEVEEIVMVETKPIEGEEQVKIDNTNNIKILAKLLTNSEEKLGTLRFIGYFQHESSFDFVFGFPKNAPQSQPATLYGLLTSQEGVTLPMRFHMARQAASYLFQLHASKWVHKSIQSESLLFFTKPTGIGLNYRHPYLGNFEYARSISGHTVKTADDNLDRNLYRHPERQNKPTKDFTKVHDLYSLGVVLLEIGLWMTVKQIRDEMETVDAKTAAYASPDGKPLGKDLQKALIARAKKELPKTMGPHYKNAVILCLAEQWGVEETDDDFEYVVQTELVDNLSIEKLKEVDD